MSFRRSHAGLLVLLSLTFLWALHNRFVQDDAFISFRYARNLVDGHGLVFNPGERVEGYTNFLWTVLMAVPLALDADPVRFSWVVGLLLFPGSIYLTYRIGRSLSRRRDVGWMAAGLTGANFSYSAWATGGMETQAQSFLFLAVARLLVLVADRPSYPRLLLFSFAAAAAFLLRMDSAVLIAPALAAVSVALWSPRRPARLLAALLPAALIAGAWMAWKIGYYGRLLPNTFFAKATGATVLPGLYFAALYAFSYGLPLIVPFAVRPILRDRPRPDLATGFVLAVTVLWIAYVAAVGGDFMEFRLMVPVIPFISVFAAWTVAAVFPKPSARIAWMLVFGAISLFHSQRDRLYGVETVRALERHVREGGWIEAGRALRAHLAGSDVVIATTAAGAIPFYSELTTIDMLGLNDAWIARHGQTARTPSRRWLGEKPGHQKKAPLRYLMDRRVNLLIGHPRVVPPASRTFARSDFVGDAFWQLDALPDRGVRVVEIPIREDAVLVALYLREHPDVESAIARKRWRVYPVNGQPP
jgi:arabinofuranosyltransferase